MSEFRHKRIVKIIGIIAGIVFLLLFFTAFLIFFFYPNVNRNISSIPGIRLKNSNESLPSYVQAQMKVCYNINKNKDLCYEDLAKVLMQQFSLHNILLAIDSTQQFPEVYARCHEETHYLSRIAYEKEKSIKTVYGECTPVCQGGCYHGAIERYFIDKHVSPDNKSDFKLLQKIIPTVCGVPKTYSVPRLYYECLHGIGHAAMLVSNNSVPVSLELCDYLAASDAKDACYGGIFMENSSSSTINNFGENKYTKKDDVLYPCDVLDKKYSRICYTYQSSYFAFLAQWDWEKVGNFCLLEPQEYQEGCFITVGSNQVGYTQDIQIMKNDCSLMPNPTAKNLCIRGVINSFGGRFVNQPQYMFNFCSIVDEQDKKACYNETGSSLRDWFKNSQDSINICNQISSSRYRTWCKDNNS